MTLSKLIRTAIRSNKICSLCGGQYLGANNSKRCNNKKCVQNYRAIKENKRKAIKLNNGIGDIDLKEIHARNNYKCSICHKKVLFDKQFPHPLSPSLDHIIPLSKGGATAMQNLNLAHLSCNISKKNKINEGVQQWLF